MDNGRNHTCARLRKPLERWTGAHVEPSWRCSESGDMSPQSIGRMGSSGVFGARDRRGSFPGSWCVRKRRRRCALPAQSIGRCGFTGRVWSAAARRRFGCTFGMRQALDKEHASGRPGGAAKAVTCHRSPQGAWIRRACFGVRWQAKRDTALSVRPVWEGHGIVVRAKAPSPLRSAGAVQRAWGSPWRTLEYGGTTPLWLHVRNAPSPG
jgi:hypothetical protein